jgi:signal transduction histidine kinase
LNKKNAERQLKKQARSTFLYTVQQQILNAEKDAEATEVLLQLLKGGRG